MTQELNNPVYQALISGDQHLGFGNDHVKFFDESVSPFAGFAEGYAEGFEELHDLLPKGRVILYATPVLIPTPAPWELIREIEGVQMIFQPGLSPTVEAQPIVPLQERDVPQMVALATLTRPGPFGTRTIDFGSYYGIFEGERLAAMNGQRLHVGNYSEISAVCTHPDFLGRGYATALVEHQLQLILDQGATPFLHVRADNERAISVYERLGFRISRPMNFYFLKKAKG